MKDIPDIETVWSRIKSDDGESFRQNRVGNNRIFNNDYVIKNNTPLLCGFEAHSHQSEGCSSDNSYNQASIALETDPSALQTKTANNEVSRWLFIEA